VKKCPECGNPSYDGAPVCGNCGYKFPKAKVVAPKREDIFQQEPKVKKESSNDDTLTIIKKNKLVIGIILAITLIVICGIVFMGSGNNGSSSGTNDTSSSILPTSENLLEYSANGFEFKYPESWKSINRSDAEHPGAVFFQNEDNVTIEYYNISNDAKSLKDITQDRISYAQKSGDYVQLVETITLDGRNSSNMLLENADGDYTRYVSMFSDGKLYVFKVTGDSENSVTSEAIDNVIKTADIA
jgi:hypothetical protein